MRNIIFIMSQLVLISTLIIHYNYQTSKTVATVTFENSPKIRNSTSFLNDAEDPEQVVNSLLNAYNSHKLEEFLNTFSDDIKVYIFPDQIIGEGKESLREQYGSMFKNFPDLHCEIKSRIVKKNTVVDHEIIAGIGHTDPLEAIVIYEIANEKIVRMYLIQ